MRGEFVATGAISADADWPGFVRTLESRKKARVEIEAALRCEGVAVGVTEDVVEGVVAGAVEGVSDGVGDCSEDNDEAG